MSDEKNSGHFLTGVIVGAAVASLFTTKIGRKIVKELSENAQDLISGNLSLEQVVDRVKTEQDENQAEKKAPKKPRTFKGVKKK